MKIQHLAPEVVRKIRSSTAITDVSHCVEELIWNSLDASSNCIAVRLNLHFFKIQVVDNGDGISFDQMQLIGNRYLTSKCHTLHDLRTLKTGGFRGEALASMKDMSSLLMIESRSESSTETYCKSFNKGKHSSVKKTMNSRPSKGTTVTIVDFMYNMPVRKSAISESLDLEKCRKMIQSIALMHPNISFSLRNDTTMDICLEVKKCSSTFFTFVQLLGRSKANGLKQVSHKLDVYGINGFISIEGHFSKDLQYIYVNKRPVLRTKIHKVINSHLSKVLNSKFYLKKHYRSPVSPEYSPSRYQTVYAIFILNLTCPYDVYDILFEPQKTMIEFSEWEKVSKLTDEVVLEFLKTNELLSDSAVSQITCNQLNSNLVQQQIPEEISVFNSKYGLFSLAAKRHVDFPAECKKYSKSKNTHQESSVEDGNANNFCDRDYFHSEGNKGETFEIDVLQNENPLYQINKKQCIKNFKGCSENQEKFISLQDKTLNHSKLDRLRFKDAKSYSKIGIEGSKSDHSDTELSKATVFPCENPVMLQLPVKSTLSLLGNRNEASLLKLREKYKFKSKTTKPAVGFNSNYAKSNCNQETQTKNIKSRDLPHCYRDKSSQCPSVSENSHNKKISKFSFRDQLSVPVELRKFNKTDTPRQNAENPNEAVHDFFTFNDKSDSDNDFSETAFTRIKKKQPDDIETILNRYSGSIDNDSSSSSDETNVCKLSEQTLSPINANDSLCSTITNEVSFLDEREEECFCPDEQIKVMKENNIMAIPCENTNLISRRDIITNQLNIVKEQAMDEAGSQSKQSCPLFINEKSCVVVSPDNNVRNNCDNKCIFSRKSSCNYDKTALHSSDESHSFDVSVSSATLTNATEIELTYAANSSKYFSKGPKLLETEFLKKFEFQKGLSIKKELLNFPANVQPKLDGLSKNTMKSKKDFKPKQGMFTVIEPKPDKSSEFKSQNNNINEENNLTCSEDQILNTKPLMNNLESEQTVVEMDLSEPDSHDNKVLKFSPSLNKIYTYQEKSKLEETSVKKGVQSRWVCYENSKDKKLAYIDLVTGNSTYMIPESKPFKEFVEEKKENKKEGFPKRSHFFLTHDSSPFMARSSRTRLKTSHVNKNSNAVSDVSSLQSDLQNHIEEQEKSDWYRKWRISPGDADFENGNIESMFKNWKNPMFQIPSEEICTSQTLPQVHSIISSYSFTKLAFSRLKVIGQVDCKFIACIIQDFNDSQKGEKLLVLFDQHAVHERIRLEDLIKELHETCDNNQKKIKSSFINPSIKLALKSEEIRLLKTNQDRICQIGVYMLFESDGNCVEIYSIPSCLVEKEKSEVKKKYINAVVRIVENLLREWLMTLEHTRSNNIVVVPKVLSGILNSQACRGAIKFGDRLDLAQCEHLLSLLSECKLPFQCAHGRPAIAPVLDLKKFETYSTEKEKPSLWKLRTKVVKT